MGSLLKRNSIILCSFFILSCVHLACHATEVAAKSKAEYLVEGFYPSYPAIRNTRGFPDELVKRGEYLAKLGDCISCHTDVDGQKAAYAGGLPIATPFGTLYSPNITPDEITGIGKWTEADFLRALKEGRDPQNRNYFPVFPYMYFSNITNDDVRALYAYFMSIEAVVQKNMRQPFPFNVPGARFALWGWNLLFFFPVSDDYRYDPKQTASWNRGKYIIDGLGHCSMCHTPLNYFGAPKLQYYLTGSFIDGYWAPNITNYGLLSASPSQVAQVFAKGELINNAGPVAGPMAEVNHNSLSYLTDTDHLAIADYLKTVVSQEPLGVAPSEAKPTLKRGRQVYLSACIICHQEGKLGAPRIGASDNWFMRLKNTGLTGLYRRTIQGYNQMPVKGACVTCSKNDLMAAVDFILNKSLTRTQWRTLQQGRSAAFPSNGKEIYDESCAACHAKGKLGSPKTGNKEEWSPILKQNFDTLITNVIKGDRHPKNGGCENCSTGEVIEGIKYIVSQSKTEGNYSLW